MPNIMTGNNIDLSVVIATYCNDNPVHLSTALESILDQNLLPEEVVIVRDGPIPESLQDVISDFELEFSNSTKIIKIEKNQGLGNALRLGVYESSNELVARMDADDISAPNRFKRQVDFLSSNISIDVVGTYIGEFSENPKDIHAIREVPTTHEKISEMARWRSPMNHASVIFRRSAVLSVGNYRSVDRMEDWDLWSRLLLNGAKMANIPETLLFVRAGPLMYRRRGGWEYTREEIRTQVEFVQRGFINPLEFLRNVATRVPIRIIPSIFRQILYERLFRS